MFLYRYGLQNVGGEPLDRRVPPLRLGVYIQAPTALARAGVPVTRVERPPFLLPPALHARVGVEEPLPVVSGFGLRDLSSQLVLYSLAQPLEALAVHLAEDNTLGYLALFVGNIFLLLTQDGRGHAAVDIRSFLEGVYKVLVSGECGQDPYLYLGEIAHHQLVVFGSNNGLTQLTFGGEALQWGISTAHPSRVSLALVPPWVYPTICVPIL